MPFAEINGHRCYYRLDGGDGRPLIVLSHSLGLDHGMWDALTRQLLPHRAVLRYDTRGHGASEATPGEYSIEQLSRDVWRSPTRWAFARSSCAACRSAA